MFRRFFLIPLVLSIALSPGISPAFEPAKRGELYQALLGIDFSGRQRMLSQRIAGLSCLVYMGIDAETHAQEALEAGATYSRTLEYLLVGHAETGLAAQSDTRVLQALVEARDAFGPLSDLLTVFEGSSTISTQRLEAISARSSEVFEASKNLTNQIQASSTKALEELPLINAMIINISGRQRMLAEKAFKAFCLSQAGINVEHNLERLDNTVTIFHNTMDALVNGMPGVILPPPNRIIKAKLEEARAVWLPVKAILERALAGERLGYEEIHFTTEELETIRMLMNEAVKLYEESGDSRN